MAVRVARQKLVVCLWRGGKTAEGGDARAVSSFVILARAAADVLVDIHYYCQVR
jgi:hypothetical protein